MYVCCVCVCVCVYSACRNCGNNFISPVLKVTKLATLDTLRLYLATSSAESTQVKYEPVRVSELHNM